MTMRLADRWIAQIFNIPVRGACCLHRECFDLGTWLVTRKSPPKHSDEPCMVDRWRCPLCSRDARPRSLRVDGFLQDVRELEMTRRLDSTAILVGSNGVWRVKPEVLPAAR
jgi:hypothetical protein